jgi:hypothetical protein
MVALPEEMPVSETIDLDARIRELDIPRGPVFLNAMPERPLDDAELARLRPLAESPPPLGPAVEAAMLLQERATRAEEHAARLRGAVSLPTVVLPLLATDGWGREAVERLADAMERKV